MATFTPTAQQEAIIEHFKEAVQTASLQAMFIDAVAGSGKTSSLMLLVEELKHMSKRPGFKAVMVAFNVAIKNELYRRITELGAPVDAKTTNGLGNSILLEAAKAGAYPAPKLNEDKYFTLALNELEERGYFKPSAKMAGQIKKLADFARQTYVEPTEENLIDIVMHYGFDDISMIDESWETIWTSVKPVIDAGNRLYRKTGEIDFTDQIYLPLKYELAAPLYDVLFTDESQDLNTIRLRLTQKTIKPNGVLCYVGDPDQAIQGFTGTDTDVVNTIIRETHAVVMPLSVCWRCDADIIFMAKQVVSRIEMKSNASKGIVATVDEYKFLDELREGWKDRDPQKNKDADLVLCRVTAELVKQCLAALRKGKKAVVRGKSIGKAIAGLLDKFAKIAKLKVEQMPVAMIADLSDQYRMKQVAKLMLTKNADRKVAELDDQLETLDALLVAYLNQTDTPTAPDFKVFIDSKFSDAADEVGTTPIMFSTVHKAKGLEYDRVFILRPDLMPHPAAKIDWQVQQEYNILYVAITRAKHELYFVGGVPASLTLPDAPLPSIFIEELFDEPEEVPSLLEVASLIFSTIETEKARKQEQNTVDATIAPVLLESVVEAPVVLEPINETPVLQEPFVNALRAMKSAAGKKGGKGVKRGKVQRNVKFSEENNAFLKSLVAQGKDTSEFIDRLVSLYREVQTPSEELLEV